MAETKNCKITNKPFLITDEDFAFYAKIGVPAPTLCYDERLRRRLSWRNDRNLFYRTCSITDKKIITMHPPESPMNVVDKDYWWSDKWEPSDFGQEYDFNRPFFEQFNELNKRVPTPNIAVASSENSDYTNYNFANKNCYMCFTGNFLQDSMYCYNAQESNNCYDCLFLHNCELCYECVQCQDCYNTKYAKHSKNCNDCSFVEDCISCTNCFMCCNLRNKDYWAFNKKVSKEEYERIVASYELDSHTGLEKAKKEWEEYRLKYPKRANHNIQTENCTGEYIVQAQNCQECYLMDKGAQDCKYIFNGFPNFKDALDCTFSGDKAELQYETNATGENSSRMFFINLGFVSCHDMYYSSFAQNSKNCFGCASIRQKEYCILNKQYTKEQYQDLFPRIIQHMKSTGEWGEFFPAEISPYAYNISSAQDFLPLNKEEILSRKLNWREPDQKEYRESNYQIPDKIQDSDPSICQEILACVNTGKNYKILAKELEAYKKLNIPIPRICFDERHKNRMKKLNPYKTYKRKCAKTGQEIITTYSPERPETVYSVEAFLEEVN